MRGLWLRGSIFQFRVRVPTDLRDALGCADVSKSLGTDSPSLAIRLARMLASEIESMFEEKRREIGLGYNDRLIRQKGENATAGLTTGPRYGGASAPTVAQAHLIEAAWPHPIVALSDIYARYLSDPTKQRSARPMLAHATTRRVVEDFFGAATPIADLILPDKWSKHWPLAISGAAPNESYFAAVDGGQQISPIMRNEMDERERAKNTLGNLTLLTPPANSQNGNEGWVFKRERIAKSLLALNRDIAENEQWDEKLIRDRGEKLANAANIVWPGIA